MTLNWSPDGRPCDSQGLCEPGHTCLDGVCVADNSVPEGEACVRAEQCAKPDLYCVSEGGGTLGTCREGCASAYAAGGCGSGTYCAPVVLIAGGYITACLGSDGCTTDESCGAGAGKTCVRVPNNATACLADCEITWTATTYDDNCNPPGSPPSRVCQYVGELHHARMVCMDITEINLATEGQPCRIWSQPCDTGLTCVSGTCRAYCKDADAGCTGPGSCTSVQSDSDTINICI